MIGVLCPNCKHFAGQVTLRGKEVFACLAFPHGIPVEILTGKADHRKPYTGDRGYRFTPIDPEEWAAAQKLNEGLAKGSQ